MNKVQNPSCPHCNGIMKPVFSVAEVYSAPGVIPRMELYISGYECDDCGYQNSFDEDRKVC